jgi:hypothetical protein
MSWKILDGVTAPGAGNSIKVRGFSFHTLQTTFTGTVTALTVDLEGSLDGTSWFQLGEKIFSAGELTAKAALLHVTDKLVNHVRANITTYTGTGSVTAKYDGAQHDRGL